MKRFILPLLLSFLFGIFFPVASFAEDNRSITILATGSVKGNIDPATTRFTHNLGGLARRAHMIESIRKDKRSVLLLDCGEVFDSQRDNAEFYLKAMERMGYDALNLGVPELSFGKEFLERTRSQVSFPYIASNLLYRGGRLPWIREYVIKEVGGIKVAILGILDPDDFKEIPNQDDIKGFEVIPPEAALNRLLPEVRGKADLVILLSQLGKFREKENLALVEAVQGIDVAIFSEKNYLVTPTQKVISFHTGIEGAIMGMVTITLNDQRVLSVSERRIIPLDHSVPDNGEMLGLIETYKKEQEIKMEKMKKELTEGLQSTPQ
jgi:5'-nucleotidase / UDP-sugar diphosphatase